MSAAGVAAATLAATGCAPDGGPCGPETAVVARVVDGDTVELDTGDRVRYLLVDTPESTGGAHDCFGANAAALNRELVLGKPVALTYDAECTDRYDRLLAYVTVGGRDVNRLLLERGYACLLHIPPNGDDRLADYTAAEAEARAGRRGMWGACPRVSCE